MKPNTFTELMILTLFTLGCVGLALLLTYGLASMGEPQSIWIMELLGLMPEVK